MLEQWKSIDEAGSHQEQAVISYLYENIYKFYPLPSEVLEIRHLYQHITSSNVVQQQP